MVFLDIYHKINLFKQSYSSLTCLFVYKVLNQEVLDDRGKFEVSLKKMKVLQKKKFEDKKN